jgi:UDP-N-acetylmuramoyl-L-alanyl-D-glutamate--2,6-diaminopimelate ligase
VQTCPALGHLLSLHTLLADAEVRGADDIGVARCTCDSRRVQEGDLFVALPGSQSDGHDYVAEAVARGCSAVLSERPLEGIDVPNCVVPNSREAYGRICQALAGNPSLKLKLVGVTGTNGKTTTSWLVASVLSAAGHRVGLLGTLGYFDGEEVQPAALTTPPADQLAAWLARMVVGGCSHAVMEVSSHALDQYRVAGVRFDSACVTNVSRDHLDYHRTMRDYRLAKAKLFDYLAPEGFAVVNADDPVAAGYLRHLQRPALSVGIQSAAEITASPIEQFPSEQTFLLCAGSEIVPVRTRMIGTNHIYNCLTAAAVGLAYGIDLMTVVRGLERVEYVPGRLQRIECGQPFGVFVDFAHTPDALTGCLETLRKVTAGRVICVFGAGGDRDRPKRPLMGRAVEQAADLAVITSDNPRSEDPRAIIDQIVGGFEHGENAQVIADRVQAIHWALGQARPGDCVLIAGKGHESCQIIGHERIPLDDREIARQWLYQARPYAPCN